MVNKPTDTEGERKRAKRREYKRRYEAKYPERVAATQARRRPKQAAQARAWRARNRERHRRYMRDYRTKNPEKCAAAARKYYRHNRDRLLARQHAYVKRSYAAIAEKGWRKQGIQITYPEYEQMFAAQDGLCAICDLPGGRRRLNVDHCHKTGVVRGLLCGTCNLAVGILGDDVRSVMRVIDYMEKGR